MRSPSLLTRATSAMAKCCRCSTPSKVTPFSSFSDLTVKSQTVEAFRDENFIVGA